MLPKPKTFAWFGSRYLPLVIPIGLVLGILGGTIFFGSRYVRRESRAQITGQHAQILYALWLSQSLNDESSSILGEEPSYHLPAVLETARLRQLVALLGTRVFDKDGNFIFADAHVTESTLSADDLSQLRALKPLARLRERADLSEISVTVTEETPATGPLLEVWIPLHTSKRFVGVAQFILDGTNVAAEFKRLDRHLLLQATLTFVVGGGLLVVVFAASFRQLRRMNRLLTERTQSLLQANQELALAAKTSAVGAVTAHLIHGLKNPLSGLQNFVASRGTGADEGTEAEWELAVSTTRRMQAMIGDIVRVLRDEDGDCQYELSLEEFAHMLETKVRLLAREAGVEFRGVSGAPFRGKEAGVRFTSDLSGNAVLRNREANLLSLIIYNLAQNAIQATPHDKSVTLELRAESQTVVCEVKDEGPGIPPDQGMNLFKPCRSTKEGGSGIGLAISKQLANSIGAELDLKKTSERGSVFMLAYDFAARAQLTDSGRAARSSSR